jgi:hypothetical protein
LIVPVIAGVAIGIAGVTIGIISQERVAKQLVNGLGQPSTAPTLGPRTGCWIGDSQGERTVR